MLRVLFFASALVGVLFVGFSQFTKRLPLEREAQQTPSQLAVAPPDSQEPTIETSGSSEMMVRASADGHFYVDAQVNGTSVEFMVDTGASTVFLSPADANRIGLNLQDSDYDGIARTPNGEIAVAGVMLDRIRVGQIEFYDVAAATTRAAARTSLLGMTFLSRLDSYEVQGEKLYLAW